VMFIHEKSETHRCADIQHGTPDGVRRLLLAPSINMTPLTGVKRIRR
jgi:hypothetical protein